MTQLIALVLAFALVALASNDIGHWFARYKLPLISGFLLTGVLAGPYVLELLTADNTAHLGFVDQVSLAIIAFAAGSELFLKEMRGRLRSILMVAGGLVGVTFLAGVLALLLLSPLIPFMADMPLAARLAVGLLTASILVARSPSSAIAIVGELRARGPFTQTTLGVTVLMDVAVILLFAVCFSMADSLLTGQSVDLLSLGLLLVELVVSVGLGVGLGWLLSRLLLAIPSAWVHRALVLALGYGVFVGAEALKHWAHEALHLPVHLEPLLICMVAAFWLTNFTDAREPLARSLRAIAPAVFVAFFTLTGASLELDVIARTWPIALALFGVRVVAIGAGSWLGGTLAGDPAHFNRRGWMTYLTQAGVALGLAKNVAGAYPDWGPALATTLIALIVLNQLVGPPLFKWALFQVGEDNLKAEPAPFDGVRDALIFGVEGQSLALARMLHAKGWQVKLADVKVSRTREMGDTGVEVHHIDGIDEHTLEALDARSADAMVCLLSDDENLELCRLAYEELGTRVLVVRIHDRERAPEFTELGALIIDPRTAMISLLDRAVRSPAMASMLLGLESEADLVDVEIGNPSVDQLRVKDLRLPLDVALLYVHRDGLTRTCDADTVVQLGDRLTLSGPPEEVDKAVLKLEAAA